MPNWHSAHEGYFPKETCSSFWYKTHTPSAQQWSDMCIKRYRYYRRGIRNKDRDRSIIASCTLWMLATSSTIHLPSQCCDFLCFILSVLSWRDVQANCCLFLFLIFAFSFFCFVTNCVHLKSFSIYSNRWHSLCTENEPFESALQFIVSGFDCLPQQLTRFFNCFTACQWQQLFFLLVFGS